MNKPKIWAITIIIYVFVFLPILLIFEYHITALAVLGILICIGIDISSEDVVKKEVKK